MSGWIWLNGGLVRTHGARIDPGDRGLLLGDGLFETMRAARGRVPLLDRHLARLRDAAAVLGIPWTPDQAALEQASRELLAADGLADAALRLTLTRGPAPRGLLPPPQPRPTVLLAAFPLPPPPPPARLAVARTTCRNERSPLARLKALGYLDNLLALQEARARGADDALLLNTMGDVACAATANLFLAEPDGIVTPPVMAGALPGITRGLVLEAAAALDLGAREDTVTVERLRRAAGAFLTSSLTGLRPVVEVDGHAIGDGRPHPWCDALQAWWSSRLGVA